MADLLQGLADRGVGVPSLSRDALLELGGALTIAAWEGSELTAHRDVGLPTAGTAVRYALTTTLRSGRFDPLLSRQVLGMYVDHLAWHAQADLAADIVLDGGDEDALVDAVARLVWARRRYAA